MKLLPCYDGKRHRWTKRSSYQHGGSYEKWCSRCGKWYAPLLEESRKAGIEVEP